MKTVIVKQNKQKRFFFFKKITYLKGDEKGKLRGYIQDLVKVRCIMPMHGFLYLLSLIFTLLSNCGIDNSTEIAFDSGWSRKLQPFLKLILSRNMKMAIFFCSRNV